VTLDLRHAGVRAFLLLWTGQAVSLLGSGLTAFSLGIWIFQRTQSATQFTLVTFCAAAPPLIVLPFAGPIIDRWDRKRLLIACDLIGAAASGAVVALAYSGALSLASACLIVAVTASAAAVQWPTSAAAVTTMVPREHLGRASGMTNLAQATSQVLAPLIAGALVTTIGLAGIAAIDLATFLFSAALLLAAAIPPGAARGGRRGYWADVPLGLRYIFRSPGLGVLLVMFTGVNFFTELAAVLFTPLVLGLSTPAALGTILAIGSLGMVAGGALLAVWGGPRRPALGASLFAAASGVAVAAVGVTASIPAIAAAAALYFFCEPLMMGSSQVVWQRAVPADLQGRVFATRAMIAMSAVPLASLVAGPVTDRVFEPLMQAGRPLAEVFGPIVGVGHGRGAALMFVVAGSLSVMSAIAAGLSASLRRLDEAAGAAPAGATASVPT
jgi:MFS family permease